MHTISGNDLFDDHLFPNYTVLDGKLNHNFKNFDLLTGQFKRPSKKELVGNLKLIKKKGLVDRLKVFLGQNSTAYLFFTNLIKNSLGSMLPGALVQKDQFQTYDPLLNQRVLRYLKKPPGWIKKLKKEHYENLTKLNSMVKQFGAELAVVVIPQVEQLYSKEWEKAIANQGVLFQIDLPQKELFSYMSKESILFLDPYLIIKNHIENRGKKFNYPIDGHFNSEGNRFLANFVSDKFPALLGWNVKSSTK